MIRKYSVRRFEFFRTDVVEQFESACIYFSISHGLLQCATGLVGMVAVVEAALAEIGRELDKSLFDFTEAQMM